jgi:hypothetical protein
LRAIGARKKLADEFAVTILDRVREVPTRFGRRAMLRRPINSRTLELAASSE